MSRTFVLLVLALMPVSAAAQSAGDAAARAQAVHALNRLTFGPRPGDVERVLALGVDRWIEQQLHPAEQPLAVYNPLYAGCAAWAAPFDSIGEAAASMVMASVRTGGVVMRGAAMSAAPPNSTVTMRARSSGLILDRRVTTSPARTESVQLMACRLMRMETSEQQLREVLTDFWLNHFSVYSLRVPDRASLVAYERAIRERALGSFRDLLGAVAHSPAMLHYLDNHISAAGLGRLSLLDVATGRTTSSFHELTHLGLNENYGRELLELHTLGVDGGYTQDDVINVARAFTGWSHTAWTRGCIEGPAPNPIRPGAIRLCRTFEPRLPLFYFDSVAHDAEPKVVLGHALAEKRGLEDGEQVLDILAAHPATAQRIARKLAVRFISDTPPQAVVDRAAEAYLRTNGNIGEVMRTIVTSREFTAARGAKLRTPLELVLATRRALGAEYDNAGETVETLLDLDQPPFGRISPDGWPETGAEWMNTGAVMNRVNFARAVALGETKSIRVEQWQHWQELTQLTYVRQVDRVIELLLHDNASTQLRSALLSAGPQQTVRPGSIAAELALRNLLSLVLGSPDFQRR
jgi:uncharacterized protein (DUF1800 family)